MTTATMKRCSKCGETKPLSEFHQRKKSKDGRQAVCKVCTRVYDVEHRKANYESCRAAVRNYNYKSQYGITLSKYDEMLEAQGGGCASCGKTPEKNGRRLAVDHDHETGEVRGLLCIHCNNIVGYLESCPELYNLVVRYLRFCKLRKVPEEE